MKSAEIPISKMSSVQVIIQKIAEREGIDPLEMSPPLYEVIDTDALESLLDSADKSLRVEFEYRGYDVIVSGDNQIRVEPQTD